MTTATEQDQTAQSEEVNETGDVNEAVGTVATEKEEGLIAQEKVGVSAEDIMSDVSDDVEPQEEVEPGVSPESQAKINRKINDAIKNKKISENRATIAENRAAIAEKKLADFELTQSAPKERPQVPVREDYDTAEDYRANYAKYEDDTITYNKSLNAISDQTTSKQIANEGNLTRFQERSVRMKTKFPDFIELVLTSNPDGSNPFGNLSEPILSSEYSSEIAYFLRKNPDQLESLKKQDRNSVLLKIGELSGIFKTEQKKSTKAPKPLNPLKGDSDTKPIGSIYDIKDNSEFLRKRNEEVRRNRGPK